MLLLALKQKLISGKTLLSLARLQLQKDIGRSTAGSVSLSNGFPIKLIDLTMEHLPELHSVEKVKTILPLYSDDIASALFSIIKKHTSL